MKTVQEGLAKIKISEKSKVSKELPVFYNPVMKLNRDFSILLINAVKDKDMQIALPLSATGVRGIRFLKELKKGKTREVFFNDKETSEHIKRNLKINNLSAKVFSKDANMFLLEGKGFDYIDIDPFGSPNPFLDSAIVRLARQGILAVTATDTSALAGTYPKVCKRNYWAKPLRNELMHELGIRILIRKIQLIGTQYEKALTPLFSYFQDHYYRIFFRCEKGKKKADNIIKQHKYFIYNTKTLEMKTSSNFDERKEYTGPLWIGALWDEKIVEKMYKATDKSNEKLYKLLQIIKEESKIEAVGFYDLHKLAKVNNVKIPKVEEVLEMNKNSARTHFLNWGIRSKNLPVW